mmetsp:Transcript_34499/g.39393  ORF Transcript_34499/g.39393 Transcript_34499/m.39393 type:complete len:80 (+) Transcript_34499:405-644(+)
MTDDKNSSFSFLRVEYLASSSHSRLVCEADTEPPFPWECCPMETQIQYRHHYTSDLIMVLGKPNVDWFELIVRCPNSND